METSITKKDFDSIKNFIESYLIEKELFFEKWEPYVDIRIDTLKVFDRKNNNVYNIFISFRQDNKFGFGINILESRNFQKYQNETIIYDNNYHNNIKSIINNMIN